MYLRYLSILRRRLKPLKKKGDRSTRTNPESYEVITLDITPYLSDRPHRSRVDQIERSHSTDRTLGESYHNPVKPSLPFANGSGSDRVSKLDDTHMLGNLTLPNPFSDVQREEVLSILNSVLPQIEA